MARSFKCDRCGKYYDTEVNGDEFQVFRRGASKLDICPKCYRQLDRWVNMQKTYRQTIIETPEFNGGFSFE